MTVEIELPTPESFPAFPYSPPYDIQVDLMRHLYSNIEKQKVTIIESPTGTGKTLSLLCASMTWLRDDKQRAKRGKLSSITNNGAEAKDWVVQQTLDRARRELEAEEEDYELRLAKARKREAAMKKMARARVRKKQKHAEEVINNNLDEDDDQFLPQEEEEDGERDMNISPALRALMAKVDRPLGQSQDEIEPTCTKIYYASRTHSQLAQILPELEKLKLQFNVGSYHSSATGNIKTLKRTSEDADLDQTEGRPCVRTVSLGSRKQLCINDELRAKSKDLDESCRELLNEKGAKRCQFLPPVGEDSQLLDFRDQVLAAPKDIEELAEAGRLAQVCPYFGSRRAIPQAELVTLPYNLLLQPTAREALGIDLTNQIIIVDEAHNLIPTLLSLSTVRLTSSILSLSFQQVCAYVTKFRNRLSPANLLQLKRLVVFMDALKKFVAEWMESHLNQGKSSVSAQGQTTEVMTVAQLLEKMGRKVASVNVLEIESYLKKSKIARKIAGYSDKQSQIDTTVTAKERSKGATPPLYAVEAFMLAVSGSNEDGRLTVSLCSNEEVELKYHLFNPSPQFKEVVDAARSVILAGGTMSPISDVVNQLLSYVPSERFSSFSCGHIIPKSSLQTLIVTKGPRNGDVQYKAERQNNSEVIQELGQMLLNFARIVPGGMVVFFPSYNLLNKAKAAWQSNGLLDKLSGRKQMFFEPTESTDVEKIMREYGAAALAQNADRKVRGALLLAVVGAKLSEGLNFADDLARAVVVIGLPFANLGSPELRERLEYVKRHQIHANNKLVKGQKDAAAELYENMCMNAVNQSIGRAIRHQNDWASLVLLDQRYTQPSIRDKLPKWIGSELTVTETFGATMQALGGFYRDKRTLRT